MQAKQHQHDLVDVKSHIRILFIYRAAEIYGLLLSCLLLCHWNCIKLLQKFIIKLDMKLYALLLLASLKSPSAQATGNYRSNYLENWTWEMLSSSSNSKRSQANCTHNAKLFASQQQQSKANGKRSC